MGADDDEPRSGLADAAGRAAFFPARAAARVWRGPLEEAVDEVLSAPELTRVLDRALAGSLPEEIARSLVRHRVLERIAAELATSGELERLVTRALATQQTLELTDRVLASDETQRVLRHVASSPELRDAIARQTTGLDRRGGRRRPRLRSAARRAGRAGRAPAFANRAPDLRRDRDTRDRACDRRGSDHASSSCRWWGSLRSSRRWSGTSARSGSSAPCSPRARCWSRARTSSSSGAQPGRRPGCGCCACASSGQVTQPPSIGRSLVRVVGLELAIVPLFAGFIPVLFTERRRGLPDFLAGTVVLYDETRVRVPYHDARP